MVETDLRLKCRLTQHDPATHPRKVLQLHEVDLSRLLQVDLFIPSRPTNLAGRLAARPKTEHCQAGVTTLDISDSQLSVSSAAAGGPFMRFTSECANRYEHIKPYSENRNHR
jgi:hypothetical protein